MTVFRCGRLLLDGEFVDDGLLETAGDSISRAEPWPKGGPQEFIDLQALAVIPAPVNGHLHSFQHLLRGVADDLPFGGWRDALYRYTTQLTADDIELLALFAYSEAALRGTGTVCDFFYIHHGSNEYDLRLARAAGDVGIRLVIARSMIDSEEAPEAYRESPSAARANFRELRAELKGNPLVIAIPAPHSPHRASEVMFIAAAALAADFDCPWHTHLAEAKSETTTTRGRYGLTPLNWLNSLGVFGRRCCLVHGVWLAPDEVKLVAGAGAKLIHCPGSNQFLGDGIAPLGDYLARGVDVALGTDSGSANNHISMFLEMRQAALLRRVATTDQSAFSAAVAFKMATCGGAAITGLPVGELKPGMKADFVALNPNALSLLPNTSLLNNIVFSLEQEAIREVYVGGKAVVTGGRLAWRGAAELPERIRELALRLGLGRS
ncbi:MAG: amidohydrolase family protein [Dehalococcoidia bacterium]